MEAVEVESADNMDNEAYLLGRALLTAVRKAGGTITITKEEFEVPGTLDMEITEEKMVFRFVAVPKETV